MINQQTLDLAGEVLNTLKQQGKTVATAESCTGGLLFATLTHHAGSSQVMDRAFITYSNQSKIDHLNVNPNTLKKHGAVSAETVQEMLTGTLKNTPADIAIAISGIAGPGGTENKPQGLVYIGIQHRGADPRITKNNFGGDRESVREQAVIKALKIIQNK